MNFKNFVKESTNFDWKRPRLHGRLYCVWWKKDPVLQTITVTYEDFISKKTLDKFLRPYFFVPSARESLMRDILNPDIPITSFERIASVGIFKFSYNPYLLIENCDKEYPEVGHKKRVETSYMCPQWFKNAYKAFEAKARKEGLSSMGYEDAEGASDIL
jgi:hypothetical protein